MSLIKCPECNGNVSDKAELCPHCGFSIKDYLKVADEIIICPKCGSSSEVHSKGVCCLCDTKVINTHRLFSYKYDGGLEDERRIIEEEYEKLKPLGLHDPEWHKIQLLVYNGSLSWEPTDEERAAWKKYKKKIEEIRTRDGFYEERNRREKEQSQPKKLTIKCPNCGSTRTQRISSTSRVAGVLTLGLASGSVGKTYKCKTCKYKW